MISRRTVLTLMLSLYVASGIFTGCGNSSKLIVPKQTRNLSQSELWESDIRKRLEKMKIFRKLRKNPRIDIEIDPDTSIYSEGMLACFKNITPMISKKYRGRLSATPFSMVSPEDTAEYNSSLYHELVHVDQDSRLWHYFRDDNSMKLPEWKMKFYYAKIPEKEKIHIGAELDACYKQALFEKKNRGKIDDSTLALFFVNYLRIQETENYLQYEKIRKTVSKYYRNINKISGYDLKSFTREYLEK